ncbi:MAG: hypothetical protein ACOCWA_05395 [Bacteroidota bacterium]
MDKILILLVCCTLILSACEEKKEEPRSKASVSLSSEILGTNIYYVNGFSFEEDEYISSLNTTGSIPDIIPQNILKPDQEVVGLALSAGPGNNYGFYKNFESENFSEAEEFYENYLEAEAVNFSSLSDTIRVGQVYTFRTYKDNYVKFLVEDVRKYPGLYPEGYVEADIRFNIQRNGSDVFDQ